MDYFSKNKVLGGTIIALIILNIVSVGTFWLGLIHPPGLNPPRIFPSPRMGEFIQKELKLNPEQRRQFEQLRENHLQASRSLQDSIHQLKKEVFDELLKDSPDTNKSESFFRLAAEKQVMLDRVTFYHFLQMRSICKQDQIPAFQRMLKDILIQMRPNDAPPPPERP